LTDAPACDVCGAETAPDDETCRECGNDLRADADSRATTMEDPEGQSHAISPDDKTAKALQRALQPSIELVRRLGAGGMSTVYLGREPTLRRMVAVKVLSKELADDPVARARFVREAEAAAGIVDPHVIDIYQVGELPRTRNPFIVMRYVDGPTLDELVRSEGGISEMTARAVIGEVALALAAAHSRGVLHRDIKPPNIVIDRRTGEATVLDFGISAALRPGALGDEDLTLQGATLGTPAYMSPEQASASELTDRSDVYSLGVVAFELLAGQKPFVADAPEAYMIAHVKDAPPELGRIRPDIDPFLAGLVGRCLAKDPAARPSAAAVAGAVLRRTREPVEWPPPGLRTLRSTGWRALTAIGAAAAVAVGAAVVLWLSGAAGVPGGGGVGSVHTTALSLLLAVGAVAAAAGVGRTWNFLRHFAAARRLGYPSAVALDVALDHLPDTAAVLNASGPYALLTAAQRRRLLVFRRIMCAALFVAAAYALVAPIWWMVRVGPSPGGGGLIGPAEMLLYVAPPAACLLIAAILALPRGFARHRFRFGHMLRSVFGSPRAASGESVDRWLLTVGRDPARVRPGLRWLRAIFRLGAGATVLALLACMLTIVAATRTASSVSQRWTLAARFALPQPASESVRLFDATRVLPPIGIGSTDRPPTDDLVALAGVSSAGLDPQSIISDTSLSAPIRLWTIAGLVSGFCTSPGEILFGADQSRGTRLALAPSSARDLPGVDGWVDRQQELLTRWRTPPGQATAGGGRTLSARWFGMFGLAGYADRIAYCRAAIS